jgi:hypothetical protein
MELQWMCNVELFLGRDKKQGEVIPDRGGPSSMRLNLQMEVP